MSDLQRLSRIYLSFQKMSPCALAPNSVQFSGKEEWREIGPEIPASNRLLCPHPPHGLHIRPPVTKLYALSHSTTMFHWKINTVISQEIT